MSYIPKQDKTPQVELKTKIREDTKALLADYAKHWNYDQDYCIEQLILAGIRRDAEFQKARKKSASAKAGAA